MFCRSVDGLHIKRSEKLLFADSFAGAALCLAYTIVAIQSQESFEWYFPGRKNGLTAISAGTDEGDGGNL